MIHLVGPGRAGKTTIGSALATRLGQRFLDLDIEFRTRYGDISAHLDTHGYEPYAAGNVALYLDLVGGRLQPDVVSLSSGFMTYSQDTHPDYAALRQRIGSSPSTFVLLPSTDLETCVHETVRRQLTRPFSRSAEREEQVIRARFGVYCRLPAKKIETAKPLDVVVDDILTHLR